MDRTENVDAAMHHALQLAFFIHGDKATATQVAAQALSKLQLAAQAQDKRLYYTPSGRAAARSARTKVSLGEHHLLQRLVYIESEAFEKRREAEGQVDAEDLMIHFIKHLMKITLKRNSFYVALGLSRLLHNYSTAETMEIYNLVVQDPERVRDDYYYRSRKARLMTEMKERFGELIKATRQNRGEERFESDTLSGLSKPLVSECLEQFTPWQTRCILPEKFDPTREVIKGLSFASKDPDAEHAIEVNRFHSLIHPDCYLHLVDALQFDTPANRLDIPRFYLAEKAQKPPRNRHSSNWSDTDMDDMKNHLREQAARRKSFSANLLRLLVDGVEQQTMDLRRATQSQLYVQGDAELMEVIGVNGKEEVLLAVRLFDEASVKNLRTAIRLEGGQEIAFTLTPSFDSVGEIEEMLVEVGYSETHLWRAARLAMRQSLTRWSEVMTGGAIVGWAKPALALALLALLVAGVWFFARRGNDFSKHQQQAQKEKQTPASNEKREVAPTPEPKQNQEKPQQAENQNPQTPPATKPQEPPPAPRQNNRQTSPVATTDSKRKSPDVSAPRHQVPLAPDQQDTIAIVPDTRGSVPRPTGLLLPEVKSIALDVQGDEELNQQLTEKLTAAFASTSRFKLVERNQADALLKIFIKREKSGAVFSVRLANDKLFVIFPIEAKSASRKYTGSPEVVAAKILSDLVTASGKRKP
ncbi:MAG: hypothetical protein HY231_20910 [Acidobacteria bacterium]|nr:hypothetical protein [Acidobacteriota bacterium]